MTDFLPGAEATRLRLRPLKRALKQPHFTWRIVLAAFRRCNFSQMSSGSGGKTRIHWHSSIMICCCLLPLLIFVPAALAQNEPTTTQRDPVDLAQRYLGYDGEPIIPSLTSLYEPGDTLELWVSKSEGPTRVTTTLAAAGPLVYLWVEEGLEYDSATMNQMAGQLSLVYDALQRRENYTEPLTLFGQTGVSDPSALLSVPDVDNDPHLYIVYTTDLREDRDTIVNPNDSLPAALAPAGYSNQHEMIFINTTPYTDVELENPLYFNTLIGAIYQFIMGVNNPTQAPWLEESLNLSLRYQFRQATLSAQEAQAFLAEPNTSLLRLPGVTNRAQTGNGQQMFLNYLVQRFGVDVYRDLFLQSGSGLSAVDAALARSSIVDPVSGAEVSGRDAFADFVLANLINYPLGDGRYVHTITPLQSSQRASMTPITDLANAKLTGQMVQQFGTIYYSYAAAEAQTVSFNFSGAETVARLPMPAESDDADTFYWSGREPGQNTTMTRAFDLRDVETATLTFDLWHDLASEWNYGYVSVSTDSGLTWTPLPSRSDERGTTNDNRHGVAYGPAFTGISSAEEPRPFPIMGVIIAQDGVTLGQITPDSPAEAAGLQSGDVVIGYDGELWPGVPNVVGLLANYNPGDTLNLYIQRGSRRLDVPLVLGAHPTRVVQPDPLWSTQTVDLTPFVGQEIQLRFEYVSLPGRENNGFAVDNITIPEIGYADDGDWMLNGWETVTNILPQQWLVQTVTTGTESSPPRVRPLIDVGSAATSGEWTFALQPAETLLIAISGLNDDTYEAATFSIELREG